MDLKVWTDHVSWDAFVTQHAPQSGAFLQSWAWGEFQIAAGRTVRRFAWEDNGKMVAAAQVIVHRLPVARAYVYCPRGPIVAEGWGNEETFQHLKEIADRADATFVRVEPPWPNYPVRKRFLKTIDLQPSDTLISDLRPSQEARQAVINPKTRYNARLAAKKGVEIEIAGATTFEDVWPIFEVTAKRGGFHLHPKAYYETMLSVLKDGPCRAFLAVARLQGKILVANLMIDHAGTRTYLHAASSNEHREVKAPCLLQDALMEDAAQKGMAAYDWWGVAPEGASAKHAWTGVTNFKLGFGGKRLSYPGTFDAIIHPVRYGLYVVARRARRLV